MYLKIRENMQLPGTLFDSLRVTVRVNFVRRLLWDSFR